MDTFANRLAHAMESAEMRITDLSNATGVSKGRRGYYRLNMDGQGMLRSEGQRGFDESPHLHVINGSVEPFFCTPCAISCAI